MPLPEINASILWTNADETEGAQAAHQGDDKDERVHTGLPRHQKGANDVVHAAEHEDADGGGDDAFLDQVPAERQPQGGGNPDDGRAAQGHEREDRRHHAPDRRTRHAEEREGDPPMTPWMTAITSVEVTLAEISAEAP